MNLILAIFWGVLALGLFLYPLLNPDGMRLEIGKTGISFAWLAAVMCGYNLVRWSVSRPPRRGPAAPPDERIRRLPPKPEYNPEFDFGEEKK